MSKKKLAGKVINKSEKTVKVLISRRVRHPKYLKIYKVNKTYLVHDEENRAKIGNSVEIVESSPFSKKKSWELSKPPHQKFGGGGKIKEK